LKTVITGGSGFIGSHLTKRLIEEGRDVVVVSDFANVGKENLEQLGIKAKCKKADLRDYDQTLKSIKGAKSVFHLAAVVGGIKYLHGTKEAEVSTLRTNLAIDANVFKACVESGVERLVYASSCAVYPMDRQGSLGAVFSEDDLKLWLANPDGGYGWAKLVGEVELDLLKGINVGIARIFNIYGVNEAKGKKAHVLVDLMNKALDYPRSKFVVWGDGNQTRDFLYVSDCVEALVLFEAMASSPPVVINVGSGQAVSIKTVADKIIGISGRNLMPMYDADKFIMPKSRTADIAKAKELLSWQPKVGLDEGLEKTFEWVKDYRPDLH